MNENEMRELARKVITMLKMTEQGAVPVRKKVYLIFSGLWKNCYYMLFDDMKEMCGYEFHAVVPASWEQNGNLTKLKEFENWEKIEYQGNQEERPASEYLTIFPCFSRSLTAKTALGIDDTFESAWIRKAMEQGQRIVILKSGLERFTGKEPDAYTKTILGYVRTLLEFEIELVDSLTAVSQTNVD